MASSQVANAAGGDWRWGLRVTPGLGLAAVLLVIFLMADPPRGESEGHGGELKATTYRQDLASLARNRSFLLTTAAFTCVSFCAQALAWWGTKYIENGIRLMEAVTKQKPAIEVEK